MATQATGDLWLGLAAGAVAGLLVSLVMVLFCVRLGMDQIIVGIAIVLTAEGATSVLHRVMFGESYPRLDAVAAFEIPLLRDIPVLGGSIFSQPLAVYLGLIAVGVVGWMLRSTSWGLHVRAAGERPASLDAAGRERRARPDRRRDRPVARSPDSVAPTSRSSAPGRSCRS